MDRDAFLERIAQRRNRPIPTQRPQRPHSSNPSLAIEADSVSLADVFIGELKNVGGAVSRVTNISDAGDAFRAIIRVQGASKIVTWERSEFLAWNIDWLWDELCAKSIIASQPDSRELCLAADIGVTTAQCAVAETGSLVVHASTTCARSVSLTPTIHVALLRSSQILPTAEDAFAAVSMADAMPSSIHFITGPSRSADIENDLSIGVHGPAALHVILLDDQASLPLSGRSG